MPIKYERDDARRLITVVISDPYSIDDVLGAIERQMAENTWEYAMLYDMRETSRLSTADEAREISDRVRALSRNRARGPVALSISARPELVRAGVEFASSNRGLAIPELVLTAMQLHDWLARNAPPRKPEGL